MNNNQLLPLQYRLLGMFKFFHEFCESNGLTYYALGGTLLGAVRHQGFIPWDDDIDVGMPRKDFQKMIELLSNDESCDYLVEGPQSTDSCYLYPYAKLYDKKSTLIENTRNRLIRGVYIDIFPLDGLSDDYEKAKKEYKTIQRLRNRLIIRNLSRDKKRVWYKRLIVSFVQSLPFPSFNEKQLCLKIDEIVKKCNPIGNFKFGGNLLGAWGVKEVMETSILCSRKLYKFEDTFIYGVEDFDKYLTALYGNWKELPPIEKQVSHHEYYLDLDTPFLEYK